MRKKRQRLAEVGHVVGGSKRISGFLRSSVGIDEIGEPGIAQRPPPGAVGIGTERAGQRHFVHQSRKGVFAGRGDGAQNSLAAGVNGIRVVIAADFAAYVGFARQGQHLRSERRLQSVVAGCCKQGVDERIVTGNRLAGTRFRCRLDEIVEGHRVQRLPACEEVGLVACDQRTLLGALRQMQIDGRGEAAIEGGDRL